MSFYFLHELLEEEKEVIDINNKVVILDQQRDIQSKVALHCTGLKVTTFEIEEQKEQILCPSISQRVFRPKATRYGYTQI